MKTNWIEVLAQHEAQTTQLTRGLYEAIAGAETLDEIVPKEEMDGHELVMAAHPRLLAQQNQVRMHGLNSRDLLGEVMVFKAIASEIIEENAMLCTRH